MLDNNLDMQHASYGSKRHSWVSSACSVFELHMISGTALGRTEIKVLDYTGHQDGRYIIIKHRDVHTHIRRRI